MQIKAYAKINLYLDVTKKRSDGYHEIISIMQSVDLADDVTVTVEQSAPAQIALECDAGLPCDERNIAYRAVNSYFGGNLPCRICVKISKKIPHEAGLAGGSADCAAVLKALNQIFKKYTPKQLLALGASLGADVPFCLTNGTQIARGIGEKLQPCAPMPDCYLVIARGGAGVSTPAAYKALDVKYGNFESTDERAENGLETILSTMQSGSLTGTCLAMYNVFESVVLQEHRVASELKTCMLAKGAIAALMSGSGPSVVGVFSDPEKARTVAKTITEQGIFAQICRPVNE